MADAIDFEECFRELCNNCEVLKPGKYDRCREPCAAYTTLCRESAEYERKKKMKMVPCPQCKGRGKVEVPKDNKA